MSAATSVRPTILVLERDQAVAASMAFALRLEGFEVEVHSDPGVLARLSMTNIACLVIDADHPEVCLGDIMRELKVSGLAPPVLFTATNPKRRMLAEVVAAGARLLEKPWTGDDLVAEIRRTVLQNTPA